MIKVASPILNLLLAKGVGTKTLSDIVDKLVARGLSPDDTGIDVLADELHWREELKANAHSVQEQADLLAEQIERQNIRILVRGFDPYPQKLIRILGKDAPPVLFAKGNLALLEAKAVGFCGSRQASEKGIHVAGESARQLGEKGINVVSGYAKGVDLTAHCAALDSGGTTTIVLAEGILHFNAKREIKALLNDVNYLVISEYSPRLPWAARNAMQRNRTIIGLSDAMIVVESGTTGGTFACAEAALELQHPLFVVEYAAPAESAGGNQQFLRQGALPLRGDRHGRPILTKVFETLAAEPANETKDEVRVAESRDMLIEPPANTIETIPKPTTFTQPDENPVKQIGYPKRLIEVDLPIARISAHARREKSIRHGHISTLHIWWARRPLAACRAVICASLWPDPVDVTQADVEKAAADGRQLQLNTCPPAFRQSAVKLLLEFANRFFPKQINEEGEKLRQSASPESLARWEALAKGTMKLDPDDASEGPMVRLCLLDFIADFANWDNSTVPAYLETSRALTQAAHESLGGAPGTRPLVVDPFAGGGSIPLEALRVGADAFASDLNPIPVLLNKVVLEYIPRYGQKLVDEVRKWGAWVKNEAEKELKEFYPADADGAIPITYLWARTVLSDAPGEAEAPVEVPLMRSLWLAKSMGRKRALRWVRDSQGGVKSELIDVCYVIDGQKSKRQVRRPLLEIFEPKNEKEVEPGTVARGSATCPVTGYTTPVASVRSQLKQRRGGAADARLFAVVTKVPNVHGRTYRLPNHSDLIAFNSAANELERRERVDGTERSATGRVAARRSLEASHAGADTRCSLVPNEVISLNELRRVSVPIYGMARWGDLFSPRQALTLTTVARLVRDAGARMAISETGHSDEIAGLRNEDSRPVSTQTLLGEGDGDLQKLNYTGLAEAVITCLSMVLGRQADYVSTLAIWSSGGEFVAHTFGRQAIPMVWEFPECQPFSDSSGNFEGALGWVIRVIEANMTADQTVGHVEQATATQHPLPDDAAAAVVTDPPYYDSVPYAYLSDFFYVWMRRTLGGVHPTLFRNPGVPKEAEIVVDRPHQLSQSTKGVAFYEKELTKAFSETRRILAPSGICTIVFASKTTASWEAILKAVVDAGFVITGSWPIDTEREARVAALGQARLGSSIHLVCRPREDESGLLVESIGEWRDVLGDLPKRIHEWMPRLALEGVVGADAIFACLGPALEIFSRYSRVEKANGDTATLREYLEHVWAAVSTEALSLIFKDANAAGLEPNARLTAMWLWTIGGGGATNGNGTKANALGDDESDEESSDEEEEKVATGGTKGKATGGFLLEYDAARKISQGLGIHLEQCASLVEVKGDKARLLPVAERTKYLFGNETQSETTAARRRNKLQQKSLFAELGDAEDEVESGWTLTKGPPTGATVLDRVHQAMILFAASRGELLKRFLTEDNVGKDPRFWKLADNLNKLYPPGTDERRWIEGVLARKKGLGF